MRRSLIVIIKKKGPKRVGVTKNPWYQSRGYDSLSYALIYTEIVAII